MYRFWLELKLFWYNYQSEIIGSLIVLGFFAILLAYYLWKRSYYRKWNEAHGYLAPKDKKKKKNKKKKK